MAFQPFKKLYLSIKLVSNPETLLNTINELQNNIASSFQPLNKIQNDSTVLKDVELIAGQVNIINHTLGRKYLGYRIVGKRGFADIKDHVSNSPNLTLQLEPDQDVVVDIEVF